MDGIYVKEDFGPVYLDNSLYKAEPRFVGGPRDKAISPEGIPGRPAPGGATSYRGEDWKSRGPIPGTVYVGGDSNTSRTNMQSALRSKGYAGNIVFFTKGGAGYQDIAGKISKFEFKPGDHLIMGSMGGNEWSHSKEHSARIAPLIREFQRAKDSGANTLIFGNPKGSKVDRFEGRRAVDEAQKRSLAPFNYVSVFDQSTADKGVSPKENNVHYADYNAYVTKLISPHLGRTQATAAPTAAPTRRIRPAASPDTAKNRGGTPGKVKELTARQLNEDFYNSRVEGPRGARERKNRRNIYFRKIMNKEREAAYRMGESKSPGEAWAGKVYQEARTGGYRMPRAEHGEGPRAAKAALRWLRKNPKAKWGDTQAARDKRHRESGGVGPAPGPSDVLDVQAEALDAKNMGHIAADQPWKPKPRPFTKRGRSPQEKHEKQLYDFDASKQVHHVHDHRGDVTKTRSKKRRRSAPVVVDKPSPGTRVGPSPDAPAEARPPEKKYIRPEISSRLEEKLKRISSQQEQAKSVQMSLFDVESGSFVVRPFIQD